MATRYNTLRKTNRQSISFALLVSLIADGTINEDAGRQLTKIREEKARDVKDTDLNLDHLWAYTSYATADHLEAVFTGFVENPSNAPWQPVPKTATSPASSKKSDPGAGTGSATLTDEQLEAITDIVVGGNPPDEVELTEGLYIAIDESGDIITTLEKNEGQSRLMKYSNKWKLIDIAKQVLDDSSITKLREIISKQ